MWLWGKTKTKTMVLSFCGTAPLAACAWCGEGIYYRSNGSATGSESHLAHLNPRKRSCSWRSCCPSCPGCAVGTGLVSRELVQPPAGGSQASLLPTPRLVASCSAAHSWKLCGNQLEEENLTRQSTVCFQVIRISGIWRVSSDMHTQPSKECHPWLMSAGKECHLKDFRETAHGAGFNADFFDSPRFCGLDIFQDRLSSTGHLSEVSQGHRDIKSYFKWVQDDLRLD